MTDKSIAVEAIRRLAFQYQQMVEAADCLESFGNLETAIEAAKSAKVLAESARDVAIAERDSAVAWLAQSQADAELIGDNAREHAQNIAAEANRLSAEMLHAARDRCDDLLRVSQEKADTTLGNTVNQLSTLQLKVNEMNKQIEELAVIKTESQAQADAAQANLQVVQEQIRKLQA